jgi:hypothetical protein
MAMRHPRGTILSILFFEPGQPWYIPAATEVHAFWYGLLDSFGRFHVSEISSDEAASLAVKKHYFWLGETFGGGIRALAGAAIIYLSTGDLNGAILSVLILVGADQVAGTKRSNLP